MNSGGRSQEPSLSLPPHSFPENHHHYHDDCDDDIDDGGDKDGDNDDDNDGDEFQCWRWVGDQIKRFQVWIAVDTWISTAY